MGLRTKLVLAGIAATLVFWAFNGPFIEQRNGHYWVPVTEHTAWLARPVRLALHHPAPIDTPGPMRWRAIAPGFEVADLPALVGREEVDRIFLARIDPADFRFAVRNDPGDQTNLDQWMHRTGAVLVVNGSYFAPDGTPATPVVIDGVRTGPANYNASHAAFVSSPERTGIDDLAHEDWRTALNGAETAMVSYPLLLGPDGSSRAAADTGWLANRSFIGVDVKGRVIIGTTREAFFSLPRLADFLRRAPLDLRFALNLDGGPVACQGIALGRYKRMSYGHYEVQVDTKGRASILPGALPGPNMRHEPMPLVLAVYPRDDAKS